MKSTHGGYDGRGQARVSDPADAAAAFLGIGAPVCVAERFLTLAAELSVMVARTPEGDMRAYPPARNHHTHGVLTWSVIPGGFDDAVVRRATEIACGIAEQLQVVGLIAVELFLLEDGSLCVNELAPRPHNTITTPSAPASPASSSSSCAPSAASRWGTPTSCDPPRSTTCSAKSGRPAAPDITGILGLPGVRLHLYGKREARAGRKMGHLSACGENSEMASGASRGCLREDRGR